MAQAVFLFAFDELNRIFKKNGFHTLKSLMCVTCMNPIFSKVYFLILAIQTAYFDPKRRMKEGDYFCQSVFKTALNVHKKIPSRKTLGTLILI